MRVDRRQADATVAQHVSAKIEFERVHRRKRAEGSIGAVHGNMHMKTCTRTRARAHAHARRLHSTAIQYCTDRYLPIRRFAVTNINHGQKIRTPAIKEWHRVHKLDCLEATHADVGTTPKERGVGTGTGGQEKQGWRKAAARLKQGGRVVVRVYTGTCTRVGNAVGGGLSYGCVCMQTMPLRARRAVVQ